MKSCVAELEGCTHRDVQLASFWDEVSQSWGHWLLCGDCWLDIYCLFHPK